MGLESHVLGNLDSGLSSGFGIEGGDALDGWAEWQLCYRDV